MRVAIDARVSTTRQAQQRTIAQQRERLVAHVGEQGWSLREGHVFRDDGDSGSVLARPGLDRLRDAARNRERDRILVTAPDRLARNDVPQLVLREEFARAGCPVDFLDRPMSDDPHDQLLPQPRGAVAEYARTRIAERMRRGRLSKRRAGLLRPWTRPPSGYRRAPERPRDPTGVTVALDEAAVVAALFARYLEPTMSLAQLAQTRQRRAILTPSGNRRWRGPTSRGIRSNPTYTGQVYAQRTRSATRTAARPRSRPTPGSRSGRCRPSSARSASTRCRPNSPSIGRALRATTRHTSTYCARWSVAGAACAPAPRAPSTASITTICAMASTATGRRAATRPARRALSRPVNWTTSSGPIAAACYAIPRTAPPRSPAPRAAPGSRRSCRPAARTSAEDGQACGSNWTASRTPPCVGSSRSRNTSAAAARSSSRSRASRIRRASATARPTGTANWPGWRGH